jgi:hypothetical protein
MGSGSVTLVSTVTGDVLSSCQNVQKTPNIGPDFENILPKMISSFQIFKDFKDQMASQFNPNFKSLKSSPNLVTLPTPAKTRRKYFESVFYDYLLLNLAPRISFFSPTAKN